MRPQFLSTAVVQTIAAASLLFMASLVNAQSPRHLSKADVDKMMTELSNWGRWGKTDQLGTANLITAAKRQAAARLVTEGVSVSLSRNTDSEKAVDNDVPFGHKMMIAVGGEFNMDEYTTAYHGFATTHFDAPSHMFYAGKMYNGYPQSSITDRGTKELAVTAFRDGLFTRGVLIDIPRLKGVPYLEPSTAIYPEDLDAWEKSTGVHIEPGDAVFIRTGRWARRAEKGPWNASEHSAGLFVTCARWLKQRNVALLGSDGSHDVLPSGVEGVAWPVHRVLLVAMGMPLFDNCDLEALSKAAAAKKRWTFLLTAAPLAVTGGTGSPLNPTATF
ncbi:MAG TPA: cyclase family protein [Bryobacteraceae bacterium]|nr:cyclase family protein [Bryobacteraceae bacterium]